VERAVVLTLGIVCMVIALIVVVLVLRAARDPQLEQFSFRCYGSMRGIGIEVEAKRESAKLTPGPESVELPHGDTAGPGS
jgi:hypothetical protein